MKIMPMIMQGDATESAKTTVIDGVDDDAMMPGLLCFLKLTELGSMDDEGIIESHLSPPCWSLHLCTKTN